MSAPAPAAAVGPTASCMPPFRRTGAGPGKPSPAIRPNSNGGGTIAISADGRIIVWTPERSEPQFSLDLGNNWTPCGGLSSGERVVADPVNPAGFYACDSRAGHVLVSTNGAATFHSDRRDFPGCGKLWWRFRWRRWRGCHALGHPRHGRRSLAGVPFPWALSLQRRREKPSGNWIPCRKPIRWGLARRRPAESYPALYLLGKTGNLPGALPLRRHRANLGAHQRRSASIWLDQSCHRATRASTAGFILPPAVAASFTATRFLMPNDPGFGVGSENEFAQSGVRFPGTVIAYSTLYPSSRNRCSL